VFEVTVSVKLWVAEGDTALPAVMMIGNDPPSAVVPDSTPVVGFRVIPVGSVPDSENVGVGVPVAVTVKVPGVLGWNVVLEADVITGAAGTPQVAEGDAANRLGLTSTFPLY
jgi:hypothetical protein